jgi:hypothetical protein
LGTRNLRAISVLAVSVVIGFAGARASSQEQTWTGVISDSMCKRHHESGAEGQDTTDPDCTRDCVKGGSRYVLVVDEVIHAVANQDHQQLPEYAGMRVVVRGVLRGDAIQVATVEKAR